MNANKLIIAAALAIASAATFAQDANSADVNGASAKTRAQVIEELREARAQGLLSVPDYAYPLVQNTGSPLTRAEVVAELDGARKAGTLDVSYDYPRTVVDPVAQHKSRAEVKREIAVARADGSLFVSDYDYPHLTR
ncbi:DUF4148 domain-containing protein [Undibacterium terreum]|uniref:DUF4148 domain-containing protein n=1 Tax=Undibacterium terreum TaxID=1224302 RepID=A0A916XCQ3_9BURK|nr:DUF4148 domain-containing protein [Undibacterium terreum]GGC64272.1 hypothetical protein GCM10011396_09030 [Undibacterium terreum]